MPRKTPIVEMTKWLEAYEGGTSEAKIAQSAKRDVRTVKKGIAQAHRQRQVFHAQTELLKDALRKHHAELLGVLNDALSGIDVPPPDLQLVEGEGRQWLPVRGSRFAAVHESGRGWEVSLDAEKVAMWELVQEHLRGDHLWKTLANWRKALEVHLNARTSLKLKAAEVLMAKTGYRFGNETSPPPFVVSESAVGLLYQVALSTALGVPAVPSMGDRILSDPVASEVRTVKRTLLARAAGDEEECRARIIIASTELQMSSETGVARDTYRELAQATAKASGAAEEVVMLNLLPGQCRVCKRLGM